MYNCQKGKNNDKLNPLYFYFYMYFVIFKFGTPVFP